MAIVVPVEPPKSPTSPAFPTDYSSGTRQYKRDCQLLVSSPNGEFDLSSQRISFKIHHFERNLHPQWLEARVYNLSKNTAQGIYSIKEGGFVRLQAGYEGNIGTIFQGDLAYVAIGRENPVDTYVDIYAGDGAYAHNFATVSKTHAAGSTPQDHWNTILDAYKQYGVTEGVVSNVDLSTPKYPRAFTLFGMASEALRILARSKDASAFVHLGKLNLSHNKYADQSEVIDLNAMTGMIGMPQITLDGVVVRALINPRFATRPPPKIHLNNSDIQPALPQWQPTIGGLIPSADFQNRMQVMLAADGIYQIYFIEWIGDTRGQPWYADITCATTGVMTQSNAIKNSMGADPAGAEGGPNDGISALPPQKWPGTQ